MSFGLAFLVALGCVVLICGYAALLIWLSFKADNAFGFIGYALVWAVMVGLPLVLFLAAGIASGA